MKGIILAGGKGTRLHPLTLGVSKQLLPVHDCPMIYYPLSVLLRAGISEILIISAASDLPGFQKLLGDGSHLGVQICYEIQNEPKGIAEALIIGDAFLEGSRFVLILGDNIFYSDKLIAAFQSAPVNNQQATIFGFKVKEPNRYGVLKFDTSGVPIDIIEKPNVPPSNQAVTGMYLFPYEAVAVARNLKPSSRGELEITDVNRFFLEKNRLTVIELSSTDVWYDTGTIESLFEATHFVRALENRTGVKLGCIEEAAYRAKLISKEKFKAVARESFPSSYGDYLKELASQL